MKYLFLILVPFLVSCGDEGSNSLVQSTADHPSSSIKRGLFITSGSCYAGGLAVSSGSATVAVFDSQTGEFIRTLVDYNKFAPGDLPVGLAEYDKDHLLVAIENASGRRVDLVRKDGSQISTYLVNSTALNGVIRFLQMLTNGSLLIGKSTAIEKFSDSKARILQGANPYINAPGSSCATSTTLISSATVLGDGKILYTHAAASPNNKIAVISASGYAATSDCLSTQAAALTTALPTGSLRHSSGKILVTFGSTTTASNQVYAYDYDTSTSALSGATLALSDPSILNGPSAITEDPESGAVFIANGNSNFNNVEKFQFDSSTKKLTRAPGSSFLPPGLLTRCISSMKVMDLP